MSQRIYNNSRLDLYEECARRYAWTYVIGLEPESWAPALRDGHAGHAALRAHYQGKDEAEVLGAFDFAWDLRPHLGVADTQEERAAIIERRDYFHALLRAYRNHYVKEPFEVVQTETRFVQELVQGITLVGQVDLLVLTEWSQLAVMDHKFLSRGGAHTLNAFSESYQFTQYMWGATRETGREVTTGIANVIVKLKEIDKRGEPFQRNESIVRTPADFHNWQEDRLETIRLIEEDTKEFRTVSTQCFRRNPRACHSYGRCPFYDLCWPSVDPWFEPNKGALSHFVKRAPDYVDDAQAAIAEEIR